MTLLLAFIVVSSLISNYLLVIVKGSSRYKACPRNLEWLEKHFLDDTQTFSLRICCNVTKLWMGKLTDHWHVHPVPALQWVRLETLTMPGFDLILSKCKNDKILLGEILNDQCQLLRGTIITFSKGFDAYQLPDFDNWYITCYEVIGGGAGGGGSESTNQNHYPCVTCKLDMYCTHQRRCRDKFLHREIVNASLNSMTVLLNVGNLPFDAEIRTEVLDNNAVNTGTGQSIHYESTSKAPRNRSLKYEIDRLKLNSWYMIRTCIIVKTPPSLRHAHPHLFMADIDQFCLDDEGYRTLRAPKRYSIQNGGRPGNFGVPSSFFDLKIIQFFSIAFFVYLSVNVRLW